MNPFRYLSFALIASLLVACDQPSPQEPAPTPAAPQAQQKASDAVPEKPLVQAKPSPAPAKTAEPAKPTQAASKPKPQPAKPEPRKAPDSKLDLRLPPELAKQVEMDDALDTVPQEPFLPPMFVEKEPPPAPFQLNGRLLTNDQPNSDNSVQGAELQFQFRN